MRSLLVLFFCLPGLVNTLFAQRSAADIQENLGALVARNSVFNEGFTGFILTDPENGRELYQFRADHFFTPASNVKLFTFYVADQVLQGKAPAVFYREESDSLHLSGTGYPLLYHPLFAEYDELGPWLAQRKQPIVYHDDPGLRPERYGSGWSWDDFNDGYVYERSLLPLYGNALTISRKQQETGVTILPPGLTDNLEVIEDQRSRAFRSEFSLDFKVAKRIFEQQRIDLTRPLPITPELTGKLLQEKIGRKVRVDLRADTLLSSPEPSYFEVSLPDTVFRRLLQDSDNFIAEQLLLLAATKHHGNAELAPLFTYARDTLFPELGIDRRQWVDGSGLSRYNQFTPRQMSQVMIKIYQRTGLERTQNLLANGGSSGTLQRVFDRKKATYVWAKSGSLRNVLCLTGLVQTAGGRLLAFSFMHNNFPGRNSIHYREMEKVLDWVYDNL